MPTTTPFNNLITFSRGSNATVTGSNGLIQWAPNNLVTFSEQFDNAAWTKNAATITANNAAAPDGTSTADTFSADGTTNIHFVRQTVAAFVFPWVFSAYIKAGTANFVQMFFGVDTAVWANFDIATGVVGSVGSNQTASITPVGNGWYRCSIFSNSSTATNPAVAIVSSASAARAEINSLNTNVLIWGAQLEIGSTATTYNPTTVKNLLGFSEAFDNAGWIKSAASIVTGAQANPVNGLFNAQKLMEDTANAQHFVYNGSSVASGPVTFSVYAKFAGRQWIRLVGAGSVNVWFDLVNGVLGTVTSGATASITSVGSGWYRCSVTVTYVNTLNYIFLANANNAITYTGDGNSGVYIYGAQLSDSASLDPYVPTPGAAPSSTAFYGPRFDFDPVTRAPRGLLVEEQRTNLLTYSEQFDNAAWTKTAATVTANATTSPDGTTNADKLIENTATAEHFVETAVSVTTGTTYTFVFYAKAGERNVIAARGSTAFAADPRIRFTLTGSGTVTVDNGTPTGTITSVGNGWYRCSMTVVTNATIGAGFRLSLYNGAYSYLGDGTSGLFLYGAQLEAGAFATSYIPTVASTVTRSADVATITGQNFAQWFAATAGTITFSGTILGSPGAATVDFAQLSNGASNSIAIDVGMFDVSAPLFQVINGTTQASIDLGSITVGGSINIAGAYRADDFAGSLNGAAAIADTSGSVPTGIVQLGIGNRLGGVYMNGHIRNIRFIPARAADFQLQALST